MKLQLLKQLNEASTRRFQQTLNEQVSTIWILAFNADEPAISLEEAMSAGDDSLSVFTSEQALMHAIRDIVDYSLGVAGDEDSEDNEEVITKIFKRAKTPEQLVKALKAEAKLDIFDDVLFEIKQIHL